MIGLAHNVHKSGQIHSVFRHDSHITGGGIVFFVMKSIRVGEVGAGTAELGGLVVHHLNEPVYIGKLFRVPGLLVFPASHIVSKDNCGVIAGLNHQAVQRLVD